MRVRLLALLVLGLSAAPSRAHFNMLLPVEPTARKGQAVTFTYQWGHPFEHQLFDAPKPTSLLVLAPDGKKLDLTDKFVKVGLAGDKGKKVIEFRADGSLGPGVVARP